MWIKGRQRIPTKYLPILEELFSIDQDYFSKNLTEIEELEIQKEKLIRGLKPIIKKHEHKCSIRDADGVVEISLYNKEEMNTIERDIEKSKLTSRFKRALEVVDYNPYIDTYKLIVELMEKVQHEAILHKTIEALAHYYEVLPDWVDSESEQEVFEGDIFKVFDDNNF